MVASLPKHVRENRTEEKRIIIFSRLSDIEMIPLLSESLNASELYLRSDDTQRTTQSLQVTRDDRRCTIALFLLLYFIFNISYSTSLFAYIHWFPRLFFWVCILLRKGRVLRRLLTLTRSTISSSTFFQMLQDAKGWVRKQILSLFLSLSSLSPFVDAESMDHAR